MLFVNGVAAHEQTIHMLQTCMTTGSCVVPLVTQTGSAVNS